VIHDIAGAREAAILALPRPAKTAGSSRRTIARPGELQLLFLLVRECGRCFCGGACILLLTMTFGHGSIRNSGAARCRGYRPVSHRRILRRLRHELGIEARIRRIEGVRRSINRPPQVVGRPVDE
jgi:hypothetical protein